MDGQQNRQVPVEFSVLTLGYHDGEHMQQMMPPRPPMTLEPVHFLSKDDIHAFTEDHRFLNTIAMTPTIPTDDLLIASVLEATSVRSEGERRRYMLGAGRMLARILGRDLHRLEQILGTLSLSVPGTTSG